MKFRIQALLVVVGILVSGSASAIPTIDLIWRANGLPEIGTPTIVAGQEIIADVVLTGDSSGVSTTGVFVSFDYDDTELTAIGAVEETSVNLPGMANSFAPLSLGTAIDAGNSLILNFDQATLSTGLNVAQAVTLGSVRVRADNPMGEAGDDDIDLVAGIFNQGVDTISTSAGDGTAIFNGAEVLPEPGAGTLAAVALATLLGLRRRRS